MKISYSNNIVSNMLQNVYKVQQSSNKSALKLSTGKNINSAADGPVDMIRISRMETRIRENHVSKKNLQEGVSMLQVADMATSSLNSIAQRVNELSKQYNSETIDNDSKVAIEKETKELFEEMGNIVNNTTFNDKKLFIGGSLSVEGGQLGPISINLKDFVTPKEVTVTSSVISAQQTNNLITNSSQKGLSVAMNNTQQVVNSANIPDNTNEQNNIQVQSTNTDNNIQTALNSQSTKIVTFKNYSVDFHMPSGTDLQGTLSVDTSDYNKEHLLSLSDGENNYQGKLTFTNDKTAKFEITINQETIKGTINLNGNSDKYDLSGTNTYSVEDGKTSNVKMEFLSETTQTIPVNPNTPQNPTPTNPNNPSNPTNPNNPNPSTPTNPNTPQSTKVNFNIGNVGTTDIETLLNPDFIKENVLNPINEVRTDVGIKTNILERRIDFVSNSEEIEKESLSKIQDVDVAKEVLNMTKQDLLLSVNTQLIGEIDNNHRQYIMNLLYSDK